MPFRLGELMAVQAAIKEKQAKKAEKTPSKKTTKKSK
jgi:hypothetical protein